MRVATRRLNSGYRGGKEAMQRCLRSMSGAGAQERETEVG